MFPFEYSSDFFVVEYFGFFMDLDLLCSRGHAAMAV
jgi:hypothetical protein